MKYALAYDSPQPLIGLATFRAFCALGDMAVDDDEANGLCGQAQRFLAIHSQVYIPMIQPDIFMVLIVKGARCFNTKPEELTRVIKGPEQDNEARKIAMYLCQEMANVKFKDIAEHFNLSHMGSVRFITHQVRKRKREDMRLACTIEAAIESIIEKTT